MRTTGDLGPRTRSLDSPLPKRKLGAAIRVNVTVVALAIAAEMRAVSDAASSAVGKLLSSARSSAGDEEAHARRATKPLFMRFEDDAYDVANQDVQHEQDDQDMSDVVNVGNGHGEL